MTTEPSRHTLGALCVGGDWACSHGDLEALGDVATRLAAYAHGSLRRELSALADICFRDPDRAVATWLRLKPRVLQDDRSVSLR